MLWQCWGGYGLPGVWSHALVLLHAGRTLNLQALHGMCSTGVPWQGKCTLHRSLSSHLD